MFKVDIGRHRILEEVRVKLEIIDTGLCLLAPIGSITYFCHCIWTVIKLVNSSQQKNIIILIEMLDIFK